MTTQLLTRRHHSPATGQVFAQPDAPEAEHLALPYTRAHELCGPARRTLALMIAARLQGPILWIAPAWHRTTLNGQGLHPYIDPGRLIHVTPTRADDVLWCMEESLRAGCTPLVVAECEKPPALTPVRRLHLAAETGAEASKIKALPLILTTGDGGAAGAETRWHMAPHHSKPTSRWLLQRRRARMRPPAAWSLTWAKGQANITSATSPSS